MTYLKHACVSNTLLGLSEILYKICIFVQYIECIFLKKEQLQQKNILGNFY
jgi:hypothetical protein